MGRDYANEASGGRAIGGRRVRLIWAWGAVMRAPPRDVTEASLHHGSLRDVIPPHRPLSLSRRVPSLLLGCGSVLHCDVSSLRSPHDTALHFGGFGGLGRGVGVGGTVPNNPGSLTW